MSVEIIGNTGSSDPFTQDIDDFDQGQVTKGKLPDIVHIRVQQRNGRKCVTTVAGIPKEYNLKTILKGLKKEFCCNGSVQEVNAEETGGKVQVVTLQGDQRKNVQSFLTTNKIVKAENVKIHGF